MLARSGGQYVIVRRGLGEYPAFVVGWSDWISTCGPVALGGMVFTEYLEPLVPALAGRRVPAGVGLVLLFGLLLWRGIRIGDLSQQILSAAKALAFGGLIAVCLLVPVPAETAASPGVGAGALPSGVALVTAIVLALQAVIYTYDGWTGPLYFGEETRNPGHGIPRSMVLGVLLVILIYVLVNVAFVRVLGMSRMAGDPFVAASAGKALFGARGDLVIRLLVLISILSGMNACALMAPRILLAMSRDRLLPAALQTVNAGGTPSVAHWTSIGVAAGFIVSGTVNSVLALCAFSSWPTTRCRSSACSRSGARSPRRRGHGGCRGSPSPPDSRCWAPWRSSPGRWSAIGATAGSRCCCWRSAIRCIASSSGRDGAGEMYGGVSGRPPLARTSLASSTSPAQPCQ